MKITISECENGIWVWCGDAVFDGQTIRDCPAVLDDTVYEALALSIQFRGTDTAGRVLINGVWYRWDIH